MRVAIRCSYSRNTIRNTTQWILYSMCSAAVLDLRSGCAHTVEAATHAEASNVEKGPECDQV